VKTGSAVELPLEGPLGAGLPALGAALPETTVGDGVGLAKLEADGALEPHAAASTATTAHRARRAARDPNDRIN
jgi:hypothetical protein